MKSFDSQFSFFERSESEEFLMIQRRLRFSRKGKGKAIAGPFGQVRSIIISGFIGIVSPAVSVSKGFFIIP